MPNIHSRNWTQASKRYRAKHPLCVMCERRGKITLAAVVDHILPRHTHPHLFWDEDNWQALCMGCHSRTKQSIERIGYDKQAVDDTGWPIDALHPANAKNGKNSKTGGE